MGHRRNEGAFIVWELYDQHCSMAMDEARILSFDNPAALVVVFRDDDAHSSVWQDGLTIGHSGTGDGAQRLLAVEELAHHYVVDALGCGMRRHHDGCLCPKAEGREYLLVFQGTSCAKDDRLLELAQLSLSGLHVAHEIQEVAIVRVQHSELLIQCVLDRVVALNVPSLRIEMVLCTLPPTV